MSDFDACDFWPDFESNPEFYGCGWKWTTREGERIPITEMTDSHLRNTIDYLERKARSVLSEGLATSSPSDSRCFMGNQDLTKYLPPIYKAMVFEHNDREERISRGIRSSGS